MHTVNVSSALAIIMHSTLHQYTARGLFSKTVLLSQLDAYITFHNSVISFTTKWSESCEWTNNEWLTSQQQLNTNLLPSILHSLLWL